MNVLSRWALVVRCAQPVHVKKWELRMGPVRIRHCSRHFAIQSSHCVDRVGGKPKWLPLEFGYHDVMCMASIDNQSHQPEKNTSDILHDNQGECSSFATLLSTLKGSKHRPTLKLAAFSHRENENYILAFLQCRKKEGEREREHKKSKEKLVKRATNIACLFRPVSTVSLRFEERVAEERLA